MRASRRTPQLAVIGFLASLTLPLSGGCAHTVLAFPKPPQKATAQTVPLDIGLFLTEPFRNYAVSEFRKGDKWNYENLGATSTTQFRLELEQKFRTVEVVDERPPFTKPSARVLHAVVEPAIDRFDFEIPFTKFQIYPARMHYKITVYDMSGKVILTKSVEGIGDTQGSPGFDFAENPSRSASRAIEDGARKALETLLASEEIQPLLKQ